MSKLDQRFYEDRALRDAARQVLLADIAHAKTSLSGKAIAERVVGRVGDGAQDVFETAKTHADDKRGIIAALIGAILLWISREPILEILGLKETEEEPENDTAVAMPITEDDTVAAFPDKEPSPDLETPDERE